MRKRVVLPAPFAPMMPTIPAFGSENVRPSMSSLSPKPLRRSLTSMTGVAEPRTGRDGDLELAFVGLVGGRLGQQLLVRPEAGLALRLAGARRQADPLEFAGERLLAGVGRLLLAAHPRELLLEPTRVVALERQPATVVQLQDPLRDVVEEVPVVGDRDDRARILLEEPLQPVDGLGIEVVRGLVEEQQVRVLQQEPGERHATLLAAGQGRDVRIVRGATERVHRDIDVPLEVPGVGGVDLVLEGGLLGADRLVVGIGFGPLGHHGVVRLDERVDLGDAVHDVALDVLGRVELGFLAQVADREAGREPRLAGEPVVQAGHDLEQAGLAGSVGADDADLRARIERERDVLQHRSIGWVVAGELVGGVDVFSGHP